MATVTPAPVLDGRNGDLVAAQAIGALPSELSDRSDSNPAVAILEAAGTFFDKLIYQLNRFPSAVIQKILNLCGVPLIPAAAATVSQSFTLSAPQVNDTLIPASTTVATADGSITFATLADATVTAYTTPAGTVAVTTGSTAVVGTTTAFVTGSAWVGWQIQIPAVTGAWYTIASVTNATNLVLATNFVAGTSSGNAWNVGAVTTSVSAQATTTGSATNVGAAKLTTLTSSPSGVSTTTNGAAATGGTDLETTTAAIARAPLVFASRDVACAQQDYEQFAANTLGSGGRAHARPGYNGNTATAGSVSIACLSPSWTTSVPVSTTERAAVVRDLYARSFIGSLNLDFAAIVTTYTPTVLVYRQASYDAATVKVNIAAALNTYLSPNTYPWEREIATTDLVQTIENATGVDRVECIHGVSCVTAGAVTTTPNPMTFTANSATVTCTAGDTTLMGNGQTVLIDAVTPAAYLVIAGATTGTLTLDRAFTGSTVSVATAWFNPANTSTFGPTVTDGWRTLPYSNLSVSSSAPAASIYVVGAVT